MQSEPISAPRLAMGDQTESLRKYGLHILVHPKYDFEQFPFCFRDLPLNSPLLARASLACSAQCSDGGLAEACLRLGLATLGSAATPVGLEYWFFQRGIFATTSKLNLSMTFSNVGDPLIPSRKRSSFELCQCLAEVADWRARVANGFISR
jgi:hypothetical protein